ncbi:hypothetical protein SAY87_022725 [Trapa incisa]|uniref:Late embryogenesis abundant protein LEA-2 subgroup domain-containing protein n=1 Tax=Trapa incisa TaxID=236973 RepID=A0AAN7K4L4_9MYRT|nr:hypothetical protein SAY87_022725 [Trapa incisa]
MMPSSSISSDHSTKPAEPDNGSPEGHSQPPPPPMIGHPQYSHQQYYQQPYPPAAGYPPGHHPYPPYPPPNYGVYPNYCSAPPMAPHPHGAYYPSPAHPPPHGRPIRSPGMLLLGFIRGVLTAIMILFLISVLFSILTYIILRPQHLRFQLASFSVTDFNISGGAVKASWEARLIVENPNEKLEAYFDKVQSVLYYKELSNYLAYNMEGAVSLGTMANGTMVLRNSMASSQQRQGPVVEEMEKERKAGAVTFGLAIRMMGIMKTGTSTTMLSEHLQVSCEDIKVVFGAGAASVNGTLIAGNEPRKCSIYM